MKVPFVGLKRASNLQNALPLCRGLREERNQQLLEARPCAATGKIMKAVLCLWAREHLKGRPGPGSGLARLLKKKKQKKKHNTLLCVCACVCLCVWQRAAKQDGCARLLLAETLRGTDRVVDAEERRGMKEWFHRH